MTKKPSNWKENTLYAIDIDSYLEEERELHFPAWKVTYVQPHSRYDYVLKYDPNIAKRKEGKTAVPKLYHNCPDIFVKTDFDKLPERRPGDHATELTADFKPICTKPLSTLSTEKRGVTRFPHQKSQDQLHPAHQFPPHGFAISFPSSKRNQ